MGRGPRTCSGRPRGVISRRGGFRTPGLFRKATCSQVLVWLPSPPYFAKHVPYGLFPLLPMIRRPPWPLSAPSGADLSLYDSRILFTVRVLIRPSDVWDHRFLLNGCHGATVHHSDKAPTSVLDLGCGSGYWAIEAAKQWPVSRRVRSTRAQLTRPQNSIVTGFDMLRIQPDLHNIQAHKYLAHRVKWVHGNLSVFIVDMERMWTHPCA